MKTRPGTNIEETTLDIIREESSAINKIPTDQFDDSVRLIEKLKKGNKVITTGMGKAGHIAHNIAMTLSSTGTPSIFIHPSEAQHGDLGIMEEGDVIIAISNSGKTREVLEFLELARNFHKNTKVICITGNRRSELGQASDHILWTGGSPEVGPFGLAPTTSTTLMTVIGDVLVVNLMIEKGFTLEEYHKRHHGGYISVQAQEKIDEQNKFNGINFEEGKTYHGSLMRTRGDNPEWYIEYKTSAVYGIVKGRGNTKFQNSCKLDLVAGSDMKTWDEKYEEYTKPKMVMIGEREVPSRKVFICFPVKFKFVDGRAEVSND